MGALSASCEDFIRAAAERDPDLYDQSLRAMAEAMPGAEPAEVQSVLERLAQVLDEIGYGIGGPLVGLASSMTDYAADGTVIAGVVARRATEAMEQAARFESAYRAQYGDPPDPQDLDQVPAAMGRFPSVEGMQLVEAWFAGGEWVEALLHVAQRKDVRGALPDRDRLAAATAALAESLVPAHWLGPVLRVLDDASLIVLHRPSGRAYQLTISGIADNFQLHTLLAATLIGDAAHGLIDGEPPTTAMVEAARDGEDVTPAGGIVGQFNLVDHTGQWIFNEGRPDEIPLLRGQRVVVLDHAPYARSWNAGRSYPLMRPEITLERMLPADEAARWLSDVAPAQGG